MTNAQERKAQERQARRRRIQEAARTVFAERGYAGASIELIARAAQLSVGAIYLYFRSKEDLYTSLIEDALTVFDVEMGQIREHTEVSKRLFETWQVLVRWAERDAHAEAELVALVDHKRLVTARGVDRLIKTARTVADLLGQDAIDAGALREAAAFRTALAA
jgi:AcrR family transcriptional regulator